MSKRAQITKSDNPNARKRTDTEIARDRSLIAELHYKGFMDVEITEILNGREEIAYELSRQTISYDRRKLIQQFQKDQLENTEAWVAEELIRLNMVEREAWTAWEKSMQNEETEKVIQALREVGDNGDTELVIERIEKIAKGQVGDKGYLELILKCINERARLRGLHTFKVDVKTEQTHMHKMYKEWSPADAWGSNGQITDGEFEEAKQLTNGSKN